MKCTLLSLTLILTFSFVATAQLPGVRFSRYFPDNYTDRGVYDMKQTRDKGFILVGWDSVVSGTSAKAMALTKATPYNRGASYMLKLDSAGNTSWEVAREFYDTLYIYGLTAVQPLTDGGFVASGAARGRVSTGKDSLDFLVYRTDSRGNVLWKRAVGGSGTDRALAIVSAQDGGSLTVGVTSSNNVDVTGNHQPGLTDVWAVKMDASGNVQWKKCYGGSGSDTANAVLATPDGGFILAGSSNSSNGDLTGNLGQSDGWLLKIDGAGNLQWQHNYGGSGADAFMGIAAAPNGGYWLTGYTTSPNAGDNGGHGLADLWVVEADATGNLLYSRTFGGSGEDYGTSIQYTLNNTLLVGGFTASTDGDVSGQNGGFDQWLLSLSATGDKLWQKCTGTAQDEFGMSALMIAENSVVQAGMGTIPASSKVGGWINAFGNANHIKGTVFFDRNSNGILDSGEPSLDQVLIQVRRGGQDIGATMPSQGSFLIETDTGTYNLSITSPNNYYVFQPSTATATFASYGNTDSVGFALQPIPGIHDLYTELIPTAQNINVFRGSSYYTLFGNKGTDTVSNATIRFVKDKKAYFAGIPHPGTQISGDTLSWTIPILRPGEQSMLYVVVGVNSGIPLGDTLTSMAIVGPGAGDRTPADDTATVRQITVSSFDPNAKGENNGGSVYLSSLASGQYLNYTVYFQNTGTDTAFTVRVRDTLDTQLDWNTLEVTSASAPYQLSITDGNKLSWLFNNINLVDSNHNEPASHGYVSYRIRPKSNIAIGNVIHNDASIYFDYNLPVATNTALTLVRGTPPPFPPAPVVSGLASGYCTLRGVQKVKIINIPPPADSVTVAVWMDAASLTVGTDSSFSIQPSALAAGQHKLMVIFANSTGKDTSTYSLGVVAASTPAVKLGSNITNITSLANQVVLTATNTGGGGTAPLYTFAGDRAFTKILQAEGTANTLTISPSSLQVGDNWLYVRMRTSDTCYTVQTASDSIDVVRSSVTGVIDPDFPSQVININPNPFTSQLFVTGLQPIKTYVLRLVDVNGREIAVQKVSGQQYVTIVTTVLPKGIYVLRVYDDSKHRLIGSEKLMSLGQ